MAVTIPRVVAVVLIMVLVGGYVKGEGSDLEAKRTELAHQIGKLSQHINI
jgi:hypothetical protein